jgi:DNA-directed RNA polymerase beta' subunit
MNQLAVPYEIANNLTIPVKITRFNINSMEQLVNEGKAQYIIKGERKINLKYALNFRGTKLLVGDKIHRNGDIMEFEFFSQKLQEGDLIERNGEFLMDVKYPRKRYVKLEIGDIVERNLQDGDTVLLNRQPTLHAASMQAMEIVIKPYKTFRFNLSIAKPFNADFDGDEIDLVLSF